MGKKDKKRNEPVDIADSTSEQQRQKAGSWSSPARYAAELFGTFLLVLARRTSPAPTTTRPAWASSAWPWPSA
ncbi:hypothetical protein AB0O16_03280 [Microbacterium sp. NPDC089180]|uniref:hypothetical protein n=1 Tax=unclassified Microbacterium TaxID=2609290 RepID=UPI00341CA70F